jgi:hypothetical protein
MDAADMVYNTVDNMDANIPVPITAGVPKNHPLAFSDNNLISFTIILGQHCSE